MNDMKSISFIFFLKAWKRDEGAKNTEILLILDPAYTKEIKKGLKFADFECNIDPT